ERPRRNQGAIADIWLAPPPHLGTKAGMHRFVWDLRYPLTSAGGGRDGETGRIAGGPLALPGNYQVRLTVAGKSYTQPLKVALDPRSAGTPADLTKQFDLAMKVAGEMTRAAGAIRELDNLRRQLESLKRNASVVANPGVFTAISPLDAEAEKILTASRSANSNLSA